ncbi:hypothetical protein WJX73_005922 [Symbiochloris irregularis]|uniref:Uncharacterized protein n=1 Tax=Symbiochloris irregularis TaxID=706552 RepID=A0AAW1PZG9_9CHLO
MAREHLLSCQLLFGLIRIQIFGQKQRSSLANMGTSRAQRGQQWTQDSELVYAPAAGALTDQPAQLETEAFPDAADDTDADIASTLEQRGAATTELQRHDPEAKDATVQCVIAASSVKDNDLIKRHAGSRGGPGLKMLSPSP